MGEIWTDAEAIGALLDRVMQDCRIDPQRVYITGHSTWAGGCALFRLSNALQVCGSGSFEPVFADHCLGRQALSDSSLAVHGAADTLAPIAETKELVHAIEAAGGHPRFDSLPARDHSILDVYDWRDIYQWLLQEKLTASRGDDSN